MKKNLVVFQQSLLAYNTSSVGGALWFVLHPRWHGSWCGLCKPCAGSHLVEHSWEQHFCFVVKKPSGSRIPGSQVLTLFLSFLLWGSLNLRCSGCNHSCPIQWGLWGQLCSLCILAYHGPRYLFPYAEEEASLVRGESWLYQEMWLPFVPGGVAWSEGPVLH